MKRIGLVGAGGVARYAQLPAYREKGIKIRALSDINPDILNDVGDCFGIKRRYLSLEEMIVKEQIEVLDVATPPSTHLDILRTASKHHLSVVMQKPFLVRQEEFTQAEALIHKCRSFKLNLSGRYVSAWKKVKELLASGGIGKPVFCTIVNQDWWDRDPSRWDNSIQHYVIYEMLIHHLDLCVYWFGIPQKICARGGHSEKQMMNMMNWVTVSLEYENGFVVQLVENWAMPEYAFSTGHPFENVLITGTDGCIKANSEQVLHSRLHENCIHAWHLARPGQVLPQEMLSKNWFFDSFGEAMEDYLERMQCEVCVQEDKNYALQLTDLTFKVVNATESDCWISV